MRVLLLSRGVYPLHPPGGLERAVYHLAKHLDAAGLRVTLITRPKTCPAEAFPGEVIQVPFGEGWFRHGSVLDKTLRYPRFAERVARQAARLVLEAKADIVHAHGLLALGYARLRRKDPGLRAPLLMNPHGMEEHKTRGLKRLALTHIRRLSREAARLSDAVIATDHACLGEVERLLQVPRERIVVLPNGIDPEEIRRATPRDPLAAVSAALPALAQAFPVFLSVGRLERYKGFFDVRAALLRAGGALPPRWAWVVVGEGPDMEGLKRQSAEPGEASRILFAGRVEEALLHALYERADVFVHAPHFEGSSLVTLEAMAHGLPVVATRAGGIPDKVSGRSGRLVEPGDVTGLSRALVEVSWDKELSRSLGEEGRKRALTEFDWPSLAKRTIAVYEGLLATRAR